MFILLSNGTILNMALLINARWETTEEGAKYYRLDFLQLPSTLVVMLTDAREIAMVIQWAKNQKGADRSGLCVRDAAKVAGSVNSGGH